MVIITKLDINWYEVIKFMHEKMIYSQIYPITYEVRVHILFPKCVLVHIRDEKYDMILLSYVSTL